MIKKIIKILVNILNILFVVLSLALLFISIFKKEWFEMFIEWMKITINGLGVWNYLIVFFSSLIEAFPVLGGILPGTNILLLVGGFFGNIDKYNLINVVLIASIGAIVGNFIGYILGYFYGKIFFEKYGLYFGVGKTELKYLEAGINKWGMWGIIIGKFHPITRTFIPFVAGTVKMKSSKFMLYNSIGSFIWASLTVTAGVLFVAYYKILLQYSGTISLIIFGIIGAYIYKFKRKEFKKYWEEKNAEIEEISRK